MAKSTTCSKALQNWEKDHPGQQVTEAEEVKLIFQVPPIEKLDAPVLNTLVNCKYLSLSSNAIDKMINLNALANLEILSLSRNNIKKISGLDEIGATLKQLWLSYNMIEKLDNLQPCVKLTHLYISNNRIKNWDEIDKLKELPDLKNTNIVNNPIYDGITREEAKLRVLQRIPNLESTDGTIVDEQMKEKVRQMEGQK